MTRAFVALAAATALTTGAPAAVTAQGFGVFEHGACAMARAGTGVAAPCRDGSGMFFNPAGIVGSRGFLVTLGATLIDAHGGFTNDTTGLRTALANDPIPVPHAYVQYGVSERLAFGAALFVPYGLGTRWPDTFEGRYSGYDNDLSSLYLQPTVAVEVIDGLRLGAGLDIVVGSLGLTQRIDFYEQLAPAPAPPGTILGQLGIPRNTEVADAALSASGATGIGGNFGVIYSPSPRFSVGVRYMTKVTLDYDGTADFTQIETGIILPDGTPFGVAGPLPLDAVVADAMTAGGRLADQGVAASLPMPAQVVAGVAVRVTDALTLLADYHHVRWSVFDTLRAEFENGGVLSLPENYDNSNGVRGGFEWTPGANGTFRGGYLYHEGAAPDQTVTPLLPEGKRHEFTVGYGRQLARGFRFDAAYQYLRQQKRRGRIRGALPGDPVTTALNAGLYEFTAHLFGLSVTLAF